MVGIDGKFLAGLFPCHAKLSRIEGRVAGIESSLDRIHTDLQAGLDRAQADLRGGHIVLRGISEHPPLAVAGALGAMLQHAGESGRAAKKIAIAHPFSNVSRKNWIDAIALWRAEAPGLLKDCPSRPCPACGEERPAPLFTSYDGFPFVECGQCAAWYAPLRVNQGLFDRYFAARPEARRFADYMMTQDQIAAVAANDRARFEDYYSDLRRRAPQARAALDIGCSVGTSLDVAAAHGFDAYGVELNAAAREAAIAKGRRVAARVEELGPEQFDLITLWEALEHIDDTAAVLAFVAGRLAPDGLFALTVPNLDSPILRSLRGDSFHINGGAGFAGHINLFNQRTLGILLGRFGFEIVEAKGQYSMNLYELVAYHLGAWRGARDYLEEREIEFELPETAHQLLSAIGPVVAKWEEDYAMGPILRIVARRKAGE